VGGIDLSKSTDLTAAVVGIEKNGVTYIFCQFFMPRARYEIASAKDGVPYNVYLAKGNLTLSGENHVDYHDVQKWFDDLRNKYRIYCLKVGYDRYSAKYLVDDMAAASYHMDDVYQGENLMPVILEFEGLIKDGLIKIVGNNLLKAHFLNVALKHNTETQKFRPVKIEQRKRIDGFVATIDALTVKQKWNNEIGVLLKNTDRFAKKRMKGG
jgi:phage terminase large subunit-like protein